MAGWCSDTESDDDEVLNLNLFARKSFGFQGIPEEKVNTFKKIVTHIGASCDDNPRYVFTTVEYFNSLTEENTSFYNVTYIRDSVDANRCLNIEQYRLGPKQLEKRDFREFDPCCANFHNDNDACLVCDPNFQPKTSIAMKRWRRTTDVIIDTASKPVIKNNKMNDSSQMNNSHKDLNSPRLRTARSTWEPWEIKELFDYVIENNLIRLIKSPSTFRRMHADGILTHRKPESVRTFVRNKVLQNVGSYDLPKSVKAHLTRVKNAPSLVGKYRNNKYTSMRKQVLKDYVNKSRKASTKSGEK